MSWGMAYAAMQFGKSIRLPEWTPGRYWRLRSGEIQDVSPNPDLFLDTDTHCAAHVGPDEIKRTDWEVVT